MIKECGCYFSPTKVTFGTRIGLACQRKFAEDNPSYDEENCGIICNDPHGLFPYIFTRTRHISLTLTLALPI